MPRFLQAQKCIGSLGRRELNVNKPVIHVVVFVTMCNICSVARTEYHKIEIKHYIVRVFERIFLGLNGSYFP